MSNNRKNNVLVGYSGHSYSVYSAANASGLSIRSYLDNQINDLNPLQLEYLGSEKDEEFDRLCDSFGFVLGIGNNLVRLNSAQLIEKRGGILTSVFHPSSVISTKTSLGRGVFVAASVSVNIMASIANYVIVNTGSIIEHECTIGEASHIAPGVVLAGNVTVGSRSFIGANSVVREGVTIGCDVIVGAGSTVVKDIPDGKRVFGSPAIEA